MTKGLLLVLSAPSGCGKTTILNQVLHTLPGLVFSVSHTTRAPRPGERNGIDYHFVDDATFLRMRDQQPPGFLEWAEVHGNMYGTSVEEVERQQQAGLDVVLDIDVQGAGQVRDQTAPVTIFIAPPLARGTGAAPARPRLGSRGGRRPAPGQRSRGTGVRGHL